MFFFCANVMWLIYVSWLWPSTFSVWVMMNKQTRRLSKIPEEVRAEIGSYFVDRDPIIEDDSRKLAKLDDSTADYVRKGLTVCL